MALRVESGGVLVYNAHIESARDDKFRHKQIDEMLSDQLEPVRAHRKIGEIRGESISVEEARIRATRHERIMIVELSARRALARPAPR